MTSQNETDEGYELNAGLPGAEAEGTLSEKDTYINEATTGGIDNAGTIDFGVIVAKGAENNGCVPYDTVDGSQKPIGISSRIALKSAPQPDKVKGYRTGESLGVYRSAKVICIAAEDVREGDQVLAVASLTVSTGATSNVGGIKSGIANGTSRVAVPHHVWKTTTNSGQLGIVFVSLRDGNPNLSS